MDVEADVAFVDRGPQVVFLVAHHGRAVGIGLCHDGAHAGTAEDAVHFLDGDFRSAAVGQQHEAAEPGRVIRNVFRHPVVVGTHEREVELLVLDQRDGRLDRGGRVHHFGGHAVAVLLLDALGRVPAALAHVVEAHPCLHFLGLQAGAGIPAEVARFGQAFDDPAIAFLEAFHARGTVLELFGNALGEQVAGLVEMAVRRYEAGTSEGHDNSPIAIFYRIAFLTFQSTGCRDYNSIPKTTP